MAKRYQVLTVLCILGLVVFLSPASMTSNLLVKASSPPNSPYEGSGESLHVYEFARNESAIFTNGANNTMFTYLGSWFTNPYRGYGLHASVSNLRRTEDPVPNGDFELYDEPGNNWTLTENTGGIVKTVTRVTGGNPSYCLDTELKYGNVPNIAHAYIDNDFTYISAITPDSLILEFDIRFSGDITTSNWLSVKVSIIYQAAEVGSWTNTTDVYHPTGWDSVSFNTAAVNGSVTLRITIQKQGGGNAKVNGHVYFDNFRYLIGTNSKPSEVGLKLNDTLLSDTIGNAGEIDIYVDPNRQEEVDWINCWSTDQNFQFNSTYDITFDYEYSMHIKRENLNAASTAFNAPVDTDPTWEINYTVPMGRPPAGHVGYSYGLYLRAEWSLSAVTNSSGHDHPYVYNITSHFVKLGEIANPVGKVFSIGASSPNYILQIYPQKRSTVFEPWTNVSTGDYFVKDDWLRIMASLRPIVAADIDNAANVSIFYPDRTIWQFDDAPTFHANNTLTTIPWQIPTIDNSSAGSNWLITVSFNNLTQCGMRQQPFSIVIETSSLKLSPVDGSKVTWGQSVFVNVTWRNNDNNVNITDAAARIRYIDYNLQVQYVTLVPNGQGAYSKDFSTDLMEPDRNAEFYVELFRYGYINASYADGTHITFTINLVNDLNYVMIKPTQQSGPDEYTAETSSQQGYTSQIKFYDPYQAAYVRNDTGVWNNTVRVSYTRYHWTGSWSYYSEGSFIPNASNPIIFYKADTSYTGVERVKYEVIMRLVGAPWDYEQQNLTIIIWIVQTATELDVCRTDILYPPVGDGWQQYNNNTDVYEVRIYWNEVFNITVFYRFAENTTGIPGATVKLLVGASLYDMTDITGGYYNYLLNTLSVGLGSTYLYVNASYPEYANQTIQIGLTVEARATQLMKDKPGSTAEIPYDDDFVVTFTYEDVVPTTPVPITDASWSIIGYVAGNYTIKNNGDGTYQVSFWGNITEATYYVTITFSRTNYTSQAQYFEITIRAIHTYGSGSAESASVPWGNNVTITIVFNDTDHGYTGIAGATLSFIWQDNIQNVDYWILPLGGGVYRITLNTTKVAAGTHGFILSVTLSKNHYEAFDVLVSFEVRDVLTALFIVPPLPNTSVPWGDNITIFLTFNDTDHNYSSIEGATITCDWDAFYWSYYYNATLEAYILTIRTISRNEGSYTVQIYATITHYRTGMTLQGFVVRNIQTGYIADPPFVPSHPWSDNLTIQIEYLDLDHGGRVPFADVSTNWNNTYYTIYYYGNGIYDIELNTTCRPIGSHQLLITLSRLHYLNQTVPITIVLEPIPLNVEVISDPSPIAEYGESIVVTVRVTDWYGRLMNDTTTIYHWAGHNPLDMTFEGSGIYNTSFIANETTGTYVVTIQATKPPNYQTGIGSIMLYILPTNTKLIILTPSIQAGVGESFEISANFTTFDDTPIEDATVLYTWANRSGSLLHTSGGMYNATIDSSGLSVGQYTIYVTASRPNVVERMGTISVILTVIPTELVSDGTVLRVYWGSNFSILVTFRNANNGSAIDGASIQYSWSNLTGILQPTGDPGNYTTSLPTTVFTAGGSYQVTLTVDFPGHQFAVLQITVYIDPQPSDLVLVKTETYYPETGLVTNLSGLSWQVPWGELLLLYFNFTDSDGQPIQNATSQYNWGLGSGPLEYLDGLYVARINLTGIFEGIYTLSVNLNRQNYEPGSVTQLQMHVVKIITAIEVVADTLEMNTGDIFSITVSLNDTYHGILIPGGLVTITIPGILAETEMRDNLDGTYTYDDLSFVAEGSYQIQIKAIAGDEYYEAQRTINVLITLHPMVRQATTFGVIGAIIGMLALGAWFAYSRIFSIPWIVRKMRGMARDIGKGKTPALSKGDVGRIASRPNQMAGIAEPVYEVIGIPMAVTALPPILKTEEREAADEAIWQELKALPRLEVEQKRELFQEMKQIPPAERVWFLEDLKKQMADGTRFARRPKKPEEPEVPPEIEEEIRQKLEEFPQLGELEKERLFLQLRKLPKDEWDEIFLVLAEESKLEPTAERKQLAAEFTMLTEEEINKLAEDLKGLSKKEREKILKSLREMYLPKDDESN